MSKSIANEWNKGKTIRSTTIICTLSVYSSFILRFSMNETAFMHTAFMVSILIRTFSWLWTLTFDNIASSWINESKMNGCDWVQKSWRWVEQSEWKAQQNKERERERNREWGMKETNINSKSFMDLQSFRRSVRRALFVCPSSVRYSCIFYAIQPNI